MDENEIEAPESLRDTIENSLEIVESGGDLGTDIPNETETQGRLANRTRDAGGRVLPNNKNVAASVKTLPSSVDNPSLSTPIAATPVAPEIKHVPRPASWKKDHWEAFDKIATEHPSVAEYINQREREFQSGVSTYKQEAESARQINEAIAPFMANLDKHGIPPTQWIQSLGHAHERMSLGSPQDKVMMCAQLIKDYQIDPQGLYELFTNPNAVIPSGRPAYDPRVMQETVNRQVQEALTSREIKSEYERFVGSTDEQGNSKYPYFETVKETMAGLLQAGLAQDYQGAYEAAIRHPNHSDIFDEMQKQHQQRETQRLREVSRAAASRARSNAFSTKSSTPSGNSVNGSGKGLRDSISQAFEDAESRV